MVPENALMPRFREPFTPFRAPAESGHEIVIRFSFTYKFINIMVEGSLEVKLPTIWTVEKQR